MPSSRRARASALVAAVAASVPSVIASGDAPTPNAVGANESALGSVRMARLGFGLEDVQPNVMAKYLPHGAPGWSWSFGAWEGVEFTCGGERQEPEPKSEAEQEYDDSDSTTMPEPEPKKYIVRFGTYGSYGDTKTTKYDDAWFADPEHAGDIKWTYGVCVDGQKLLCAPQSFAYIDPFPSISDVKGGKKCQWIDASTIPESHLDGVVATGSGRLDADSVKGKLEIQVSTTSGDRETRDFQIFSSVELEEMFKKMYPDTLLFKDLLWNWCADEGVGKDFECGCNTIMRYGWTGNTTLQAPSPHEDPDFHKWTLVDVRSDAADMPQVPCNHHKLGGLRPFPERGEANRICQCLDARSMADYNAGIQAEFGGPNVPGQEIFNMTNATHFFNKTHHELDAIRAARDDGYPGDHYPASGYPGDHYPAGNYPAGHYPTGHYPTEEESADLDGTKREQYAAALGRDFFEIDRAERLEAQAAARHRAEHLNAVVATLAGIVLVASVTMIAGVAWKRSRRGFDGYEEVPEPVV